jgi:hypothetical protein
MIDESNDTERANPRLMGRSRRVRNFCADIFCASILWVVRGKSVHATPSMRNN